MTARTMSGPEHVIEAARLEQVALDHWEAGKNGPESNRMFVLAELTMRQAALHATLAQVAATVEDPEDRSYAWWQPQWSDAFTPTNPTEPRRLTEPESYVIPHGGRE